MLLPFGEGQQSWAWFEEAVRDLVRRLPGYRNVEAYGVQGDHQDGIDIRADRYGGHVGIQCKKVASFGAADTRRAVADATYSADGFILALSRRATVGTRIVVDQHGNWELWDQTRLSDAVRALPHAEAVDYIERHFHPAWVTGFLGRDRPTAFVDRAGAYEPFRHTSRLVHHEWTRVEDNGALAHLREFVASAERIAVVDGPIGIGKTKLVYDLTSENLGSPVHFLAAGATMSPEIMREIGLGPALVIVDNADAVAGLALLFGDALRNADHKVILTISAAASGATAQQLAEAGIEPADVRTISLQRLGRNATIDLVRQALGREDAQIEEAIVMHACDSPLTSLLTAKMILDRDTTSAGLESEGHVRDLVRDLYRKVATGAVADDIPRADVKAVLQLLAAVGPARIERDEWLTPAAAFLGWDLERVLRVLDAIDEARILHRLGSKYSVAPEILRQSIMLEACTARGRRTTFPERVLEHFPRDPKVLHNLAIADLESRASSGPDLFTVPWEAIAQIVRESNSLDRAHFLGELDTLGFFKPDEVFELVTYLVNHPATNEDTQPFAGTTLVIEHRSVIREVPGVLKGVIMGSRDRLPASVELLWRIGKDQRQRSFSESALQSINALANYEVGFGTGLAAAVVEVIALMIARGEADTESHSLLELIEPVLARDIELAISQGTKLTIRRTVLLVDSARELRDRALCIVTEAATAANTRRADKALEMLCDLLREPMNQAQTPAAEDVAAWDRERGAAFDAFEDIVSNGNFPLRELRIANRLPFYAHYSPSAYVRERATAILERLGTSSRRDRYRALVSEFVRADMFVDLREQTDWQEGQRRAQTFIEGVASEMLAAMTDPLEIVRDVEARLNDIRDAGLFGSPHLLFAEIQKQRPELGMPLLESILATGNAALYSWLDSFVRVEFMRDLERGEALAGRLMGLAHPDAAIAVANGLNYRSGRDARDCAVRQRVFHALVTSPAIEGRRAAAHNLMFFKNDCPDCIAELVLATQIDTDSALAEQIYMALPNDVDGVDEVTIDALTMKLVTVLELEHWPLTFMQRIATAHSARVLALFAARLFPEAAPVNYRALPSHGTALTSLIEALVASPTFESELLALIRERADIDEKQLGSLAPLLHQVARFVPDPVKRMISEALASSSDGMQRAALSWLRYLPHPALEDDVPYVIAVLERAHHISDEIGTRAQGAITAELATGAESVGHYEGAPSDMRLQAVAHAALAVDGLSVQVRRFFVGLRDHGRQLQQQTIRSAEEAFGPQ